MSHHNYSKIDTNCPRCHSDKILKDNYLEEIFCNTCGYIIQDKTRIFNVVAIIQEEEAKQIRLNQFWKKTNSSFMGGNKK
jgi:transcription initiation factor TFIIIB Brf1 subunit/transcription initiation factor TFIIB